MKVATEFTLPSGRGAAPDLAQGSVFFVGTATVLIRYAGFTILTDPNFLHRHQQARLGYGLRSTRLTDPALEIRDLPPLDLLVLSHYHGDHFDYVAERELDKLQPIVTTPHAEQALRRRGFAVPIPLHTWSAVGFARGGARLQIAATPGQHGPLGVASLLPPVMGSVLQFATGAGGPLVTLYITGDTLAITALQEIPRRFPNIDLALLHLGGTRILGIMVTMDGRQGAEAMRLVNPRLAIPIHYNDYTVFKSPLDEFKRRVEAAGLEDRVRYLAHGETHTFHIAPERLAAAQAMPELVR
ncbi:MAG TPA: MBL fold metallo-hydrolase [Anaerolineae bacterium]|nr:MBL fold metallo-hydrolase [Anaerolineae bacterium]HPL28492.1 MBL fold metallo-hydrolase [Anaerolineae bacterium]